MSNRYGYLDMSEGWSDVSDERKWAIIVCPQCRRKHSYLAHIETLASLKRQQDGTYLDEELCYECLTPETEPTPA